MPEITIAIPSYNRPDYLTQAVYSILNQSFQDFEIIIFFDNGPFDIDAWKAKFNDDRIKVEKNITNLGPRENFHKIFRYGFSSPFLVVFHDDDVMHPQMLELERRTLSQHPQAKFAATSLNFVRDGENMENFGNLSLAKDYFVCNTSADLVRLFLNGFALCFDSVMYRTQDLQDLAPFSERFYKWNDRPFLVSLAQKGGALVLKDKLVNYRIHPGQDSGGSATLSQFEKLLDVFKFYRENLSEPLSFKDQKLFFSYTTNNLMRWPSFIKTFSEARDYFQLINKCGFLRLKYLNWKGLLLFLISCKNLIFK